MSASGGPAKRISFGEGHYSTPVWSPRGDLIAFTRIKGGSFGIGVMKPDGSGERILVEGFHNEGPTFAPNGLYVMFFRDFGRLGRAEDLHDRHLRPRRVSRADAELRQRPFVGPAPELSRRPRAPTPAASRKSTSAPSRASPPGNRGISTAAAEAAIRRSPRCGAARPQPHAPDRARSPFDRAARSRARAPA